MRRRFRGIVAVYAVLAAATAAAHTGGDTPALAAALHKLRSNFIDLPVADFRPGPIPGLYEFLSNDNILYYSAQTNLLFVGNVYSKDGRSLTAARLAQLQARLPKQLPLHLALKIGDGPKRIIEFSDPECPYCQAYNRYISARARDVTRYVFFYPLTNLHPGADVAAEHILCAKDRQTAFQQVYRRKIVPTDFKTCGAGEKWLKEDQAVGNRFGVQVTPTLILGDGSVVQGFDKARIEQYLAGKPAVAKEDGNAAPSQR